MSGTAVAVGSGMMRFTVRGTSFDRDRVDTGKTDTGEEP